MGWSIHGDPVDTARETREFGLNCLESRPRNLDYSRPALADELARLRDCGGKQSHRTRTARSGVCHGKKRRPTELHTTFQALYAQLFDDAVRAGVRLAIENIHNPANTSINSSQLEFATRIDGYLRWIDAVATAIPSAPAETIGALFDIGHTRNNGGELDNSQPLGA